MSHPFSAFTSRQLRPSSRRTQWRPLLVLVSSLFCGPLLAVEIDDSARQNATSAPQSAIPWMSGGVGDEARDDMRKVAASYNVLVVFSDRRGAYLAGIPFSVAAGGGREIIAGVSEGPLLYLKLPTGGYLVSAEIDGAWQSRRLQAGTPGHPTRAKFVSRGE